MAARLQKPKAAENGPGRELTQKLWAAADKLRGNMDAAEYKHVVLGLIFLKYISDAFEEKHAELEAERAQGADPEDPDEYRAENIFWVPKEARWSHLKASAKQPTIGKLVDDAMVAIERDNPTLKGVLPKDYARPGARQAAPGRTDRPDRHHRPRRPGRTARKDILGRVYEYFLVAVRQRRGQEGRPVLHAALRRPRAGRDARAVQGPRLRPVLRLGRHVRAVARSSSRRTAAGSATSRSTARSRTTRRGGWRKMNLAIRGIEATRSRTPTASTATCTRT